MVELTKRQSRAYTDLESAIDQGKPIEIPVAKLLVLCKELETVLKDEDARLSEDGTTVEMDDRWILNLRRLEKLRDLLNRSHSMLQNVAGAAA